MLQGIRHLIIGVWLATWNDPCHSLRWAMPWYPLFLFRRFCLTVTRQLCQVVEDGSPSRHLWVSEVFKQVASWALHEIFRRRQAFCISQYSAFNIFNRPIIRPVVHVRQLSQADRFLVSCSPWDLQRSEESAGWSCSGFLKLLDLRCFEHSMSSWINRLIY